MLERMWRKGNPLTLLVGMQVGAATLENNVEIPQKIKNKATWGRSQDGGGVDDCSNIRS